VISWRVIASSTRPRADSAGAAKPGEAVKGSRRVWWGPDDGELETTVLDRARLAPGERFVGPLGVEEPESTTVVDPRCTLTIDDRMNLVIDLH
jgi:N-methylhydantoinase A